MSMGDDLASCPQVYNVPAAMRHGPKLLRYACHQKLRNQVLQSLVKRDVTSAFRGWVGESQDIFSKWE